MSIPLYILKRFLYAIPTILIVSMLVFALMRFDVTIGPVDIPIGGGNTVHVLDRTRLWNQIDPLAELRHNPQISREALKKEEERLGLHKPMPVQYWLWLSHVFQVDWRAIAEGRPLEFFQPDLGTTFNGEPVTFVLVDRSKNTLLLNVVTILLTWLVAIPLGIYAALRWRSVTDRMMTVFAAVGMAMPSFVLALLLAMVVVKTGWLPLGGIKSYNYDEMNLLEKVWDLVLHLALPVTVLTILGIAGLQRQMRGNLLDVLGAEYVRTARAKGLPEHVVIYKHAVRTAINPLITILGYTFAELLSGSLLTETVVGFPGLGVLTYSAVLRTDTNLAMACLMMSVLMLVAGNLLADVLLKIVDPRIELQ